MLYNTKWEDTSNVEFWENSLELYKQLLKEVSLNKEESEIKDWFKSHIREQLNYCKRILKERKNQIVYYKLGVLPPINQL